ncbi:hypothetical protein VNO80_18329 [Phaseolus coccineus]|uniref:Uncharacterized protein n=1 Tax=Phaseolus coccineus TaxID=3886 RepID=A0AAN9MK84_PHACN
MGWRGVEDENKIARTHPSLSRPTHPLQIVFPRIFHHPSLPFLYFQSNSSLSSIHFDSDHHCQQKLITPPIMIVSLGSEEINPRQKIED